MKQKWNKKLFFKKSTLCSQKKIFFYYRCVTCYVFNIIWTLYINNKLCRVAFKILGGLHLFCKKKRKTCSEKARGKKYKMVWNFDSCLILNFTSSFLAGIVQIGSTKRPSLFDSSLSGWVLIGCVAFKGWKKWTYIMQTFFVIF